MVQNLYSRHLGFQSLSENQIRTLNVCELISSKSLRYTSLILMKVLLKTNRFVCLFVCWIVLAWLSSGCCYLERIQFLVQTENQVVHTHLEHTKSKRRSMTICMILTRHLTTQFTVINVLLNLFIYFFYCTPCIFSFLYSNPIY